MSLFDSKRVPWIDGATENEPRHPESLGPDSGGVDSAYRERLVTHCVDQAIRLGMRQGVILEVGTGSGQLAMQLATRCPEVTVLGIDASAEKIAAATEAAERATLAGRVHFQRAALSRTRFKAEYFDGVVCDSLLHQVLDARGLLNEIARIVKKDGAVLVRDWRRPSVLSAWWHVRFFARRGGFTGAERKLFAVRLHAAYSHSEWRELLHASNLGDTAQLVVRDLSHISIERPAQASLFAGLAARQAQREYLAETESWRKGL